MAEKASPTPGTTDKYHGGETRNNPVFLLCRDDSFAVLLLIVTTALEEAHGKFGDSPEQSAQNDHTASRTKNKRAWFV